MINNPVLAPTRSGFELPNISLRGVVSAIPGEPIDNRRFIDEFGADAVQEVVAVTGVQTRHWANRSQTAADLCFEATQTLLHRIGWQASDVDALVFVSQTPDHRIPATACVLHGRLGLSHHCLAFDVNLGCSGYVYGLWIASSFVAAGCSRVLILAGDTISRSLDHRDRGTALLFGDAGSATAVEANPLAPPSRFVLGTDGRGMNNLIIPGGGFREFLPDSRMRPGFDAEHLFMDGNKVFSFTLGAVPKLVRETLGIAGEQKEAVDAFLFHQANAFMIRHLAKKIGLAPGQVPMNIDRYGNTTSASIPLLITTDLAERITSKEMSIVPVGFGVGYSWGAAHFKQVQLVCAETLVV